MNSSIRSPHLTEAHFSGGNRPKCSACKRGVLAGQPCIFAAVGPGRVQVLHASCADMAVDGSRDLKSLTFRELLERAAEAYALSRNSPLHAETVPGAKLRALRESHLICDEPMTRKFLASLLHSNEQQIKRWEKQGLPTHVWLLVRLIFNSLDRAKHLEWVAKQLEHT